VRFSQISSFAFFLLFTLVVALVVIVGAGCPAAVAASNSARIINLGTQLPGRIMNRVELIHNRGRHKLRFTQLSTSCGCVTASVSPHVVKPGGNATLRLRIVTHLDPGPASISALLLGKAGTKAWAREWTIKYVIHPMLVIMPPRHALISTQAVDIGHIKRRQLAKPIVLDVYRGNYPAKWTKLTCRCGSKDLRISIKPINDRHWRVILAFANRDIVGTHDYRLHFSFLDHGKPLTYHLEEDLELTVRGTLSLVPSSLLIGTLKADQTYRTDITLWSADPAITPQFISGHSTAPGYVHVQVINHGKKARITVTPKDKREAFPGRLTFVVRYGKKDITMHENFFAYILKRHGEPSKKIKIPKLRLYPPQTKVQGAAGE
jgi:hypothetical protein